MAEPQVTGTDVLRRAVHARIRSPHALTMMARDVGDLAVHTLENFAAGKTDLKVEALKALTKQLFPHAEFDETCNLLRSANKREARAFILPPRFDRKSTPYYLPVQAGPQIGPQPVIPVPTRPAATSRPGWASSW